MTAEHQRLAAADSGEAPWRMWGPYLAERAWGTVREDYSADGDAWTSFPFDHARSRVYRWNEDGLGGICDASQRLCLAFAFWNGRDPFLKERIFGLSNAEGNHGEDAKEHWWYVDATPTHAWLRWRYHYPQMQFPYDDLRHVNAKRSRDEPEYELADTGVLDLGYWDISVDYAKAGPSDIAIRLVVRNAGPERATLVVLPTLWFRNTWAWGLPDAPTPPPVIRADGARLVAQHPTLPTMTLVGARVGRRDPVALLCDNETNAQLLWGAANRSPYPKDAINDTVVAGADAVNPIGVGTKAALRYDLTVAAGDSAELRLRFADDASPIDLRAGFTRLVATRQREADDFYAAVLPPSTPPDEALVARQAFAGLLWSKQFFHFDVDRWLEGDPAGPKPPSQRLHGRNIGWRHLNNHDVISMPDAWEYPWYAAWDLAFHCVALAHVDPTYAKAQLVLLCREWYMHPNGQLPAYEWEFSDVNPPVHAWAALRVFEINGGDDYDFLERVFHKLLINFTWWVNRKDTEGNNVFEGGFLGLDNIGAFDRSAAPPAGGRLEQSDATAWMALYCLSMLEIALRLAGHDATYEDVATKFFEHFTYIATAIRDQGLWDEQDGFFYDVLRLTDTSLPLRARSMVGLVPLMAVIAVDERVLGQLSNFDTRLRWFLANKGQYADACVLAVGRKDRRLLAVCDPDKLVRVLSYVSAPTEFLSPHGVRALSQFHRDHPLRLDVGGVEIGVDYEPGESTTGLFGGNSNWRGPVWFPMNRLLVSALHRYHDALGDDFHVEHPVGSGQQVTLSHVADDVAQRLIALFVPDSVGRRPAAGATSWPEDLLWFHEYFHGDTGAGLGASHQSGWTALVADLIITMHSRAHG
ncbi:MAG: MGH1-like glycoside hydrolase domain-containing protein [Actinomycetes bacterium]